MAHSLCSNPEDERSKKETPTGGARLAENRSELTEPQSMAVSVTRHTQITNQTSWELLACGVDTLDIGLLVNWGATWPILQNKLEDGKTKSQGTKGILWKKTCLGPCIIHASGKPPFYRYRLSLADFNIWFSKQQTPKNNTPNVYVSVMSACLWRDNVIGAANKIYQLINELGGQVEKDTPSRIDLCADFHVPTPLSYEFLKEHLVTRSRHIGQEGLIESMQSFYIGARSAPIRCRIYDKISEIEHSKKFWFFDVWGREHFENIWRIEFQLRRKALKDYGIFSLDDALEKIGGIWQDLTNNWMSLRLPDDENVTRRSIHPRWEQVQDCAKELGPALEIKRDFDARSAASVKWYVSHIAGCTLSYAALLGFDNLEEALHSLNAVIKNHWESRNFYDQYVIKSVRLGLPVEVNDDIPF